MKYKNPIPPGLCHKHCLEVQEVQAEIKYIYNKVKDEHQTRAQQHINQEL